ncbi:hypothetical protein ACF0H5_000644 [Mactra antiquata]
MMKTVILWAVIVAVCVKEIKTFERTFEFENAPSEQQDDLDQDIRQRGWWIWRSEASALKGLHVDNAKGNPVIQLKLCLKRQSRNQRTVSVSVENIRYSNDGPLDHLWIYLDTNFLANFTTAGDYEAGHGWNKFRDTGKLGPTLQVRRGQRKITIQVSTDKYGVEFDYIRFKFENVDPNQDVFCGSSIRFVPRRNWGQLVD